MKYQWLVLLALLSGCATTYSGGDGVRTRPLVVAHRGFSSVAPENTLVAYRRAIEVGAELAECDVMLTSDGVPVLMHDDTLARTTGDPRAVADVPADEVVSLDAGQWFDATFAGETVPTLADALALVAGKLRFVIEIKDATMASAVVETIRRSPARPDDLVIFSFHRGAVIEAGRLEPRLPTVWLLDRIPTAKLDRKDLLANALAARVQGVGLSHRDVDAAFVRAAHERGLLVYCWTVNDRSDMQRVIALGVDVVITDRPDELLQLLGR